MGKTDLKKYKLTKENATAEFNRIVEAFGFNISTETKERLITMDVNNLKMQMTQELVEADSFISKIMEGKIEFENEKLEIIYKLKTPVKTGENGAVIVSEFRFGKFTRAKQIQSKIPLNKCNFALLEDEDQLKLLQAMTGESNTEAFNALSIPEFNDLRMIGGYFFN